MGKKRRDQKQLRVQMKCVPAPGSQERLSKALAILLKAAARPAASLEGSVEGKKECQPPPEDGLTSDEEGNRE